MKKLLYALVGLAFLGCFACFSIAYVMHWMRKVKYDAHQGDIVDHDF